MHRLSGRLRDVDGQRPGWALEGELLLDGERAALDAVAGVPAGGQRLGIHAELPGGPDEPVVRDVEGGGSVIDSRGGATGREPVPAAPRDRHEAQERLVGGDVEAARVSGRRRVVRTRPADDGEGETQAGIPPRPHTQAVAEADPLVPGRKDLGRWSRHEARAVAGRVAGPGAQVEGGGRELAGAVEGHLQAALRPAVAEGSTPLVRHDQPVREPPRGGVGGTAGESEPTAGVDVDAAAQEHARELGGVAHGQRPDRAAPGQGGAVGRRHRLDEAGGRAHAPLPHAAEPVGEGFGEQIGVDRVHVDLPVAGLGVVEPAFGVLAEQGPDPSEQVLQQAGVDVQPEPGPRRLAAGQDHGVVAGEDGLVEQRDPLGAVDRLGHGLPGGVAEGLEAAEPSDRLGDPVGEEGVGAPAVCRRQPAEQGRHDRQPGHIVDPRLVEQAQREAEVGVGVGVDPVARHGVGQHQAGRDALRQLLQHPHGGGDEVVGDGRGAVHVRGR
jgi:hypothetical protein